MTRWFRGFAFPLLLLSTLLAGAPRAAAQQAPPGTFDSILALCQVITSDNYRLTSEAQADLAQRCTELVVAEAPADVLVAMAREELSVLGSSATETSVAQAENVRGRIAELHRGGGGFSVAGLTVLSPSTGVRLAAAGDPARYLPGGEQGGLSRAYGAYTAYAAQDQGGAGSGVDPAYDPGYEPWGLFVSGYLGSGERDATSVESGYDFDAWDLTAGIDRRVGRSGFLGVAVGLDSHESDVLLSSLLGGGDGGSLEVEGTTLSLYGGAGESLLFDWIASYTTNDYDSRTPISYQIPGLAPDTTTTVDQTAFADTEGEEVLLSAGLTWDVASGGFSFQPTVRLTWLDATVDGYTERLEDGVGSGLALTVDDQDIESLKSTLGATLAWTNATDWGVLIPQVRVAWQHEFEDDAREVVTRFAETPDDIASLLPAGSPPTVVDLEVFTSDPDRDYFDLAVGLQAVLGGGTQLYVFLETVQDLDQVDAYGGSAGLRFAF